MSPYLKLIDDLDNISLVCTVVTIQHKVDYYLNF